MQISCTSLSVTESYTKEKILIYPNPVKESLRISNTSNLLIDLIIITDVSGKTVLEFKENASDIYVNDFEIGIYIMKILIDNKIFYKKIIKN